MLNKTKKVAFLTTGLAGALVVSSAVGVALSSCTTTSSTTTPNKFTYSIDWTDQDQLSQLTIDEQGLVYSSADKTEIITVAPNTAATSFVIPASVKYITGYNQITKTTNADTGVVTTSVTSYGAFQNQTSLISVSFASDNTLVSIGDSAFSGCTFLSSINLPSSTSVVYNNAFANCTNLRSVNLVGVSYIGASAFASAMTNGAEVSINLSGASYIGDNAFNGCTSLVSVDFSSNSTLTYIGKSAFAGSLVKGSAATLNLANASTLKTISDGAFQNCTNLASVTLPTTSALTTIGANAFNGATNLTQIGATANTFTAPSSLGNYATASVTVDSTTTTYVSSGIGANAFNGTKIATVNLSAVTTATTPFGAGAFKGMTSLSSVDFGSSSKITTIPYSLFEGDTALTELTLPASITSIASGVNNLSTSTDSTNYDLQRSPFFGSGLVTINMNNITSYATGTITINGTATDATGILPNGLFQDITTLKTVYLKAGTVALGTNAFEGTTALTTVKEGSSLTNTTDGDGFLIPATLEWTGYYTFKESGIKTVAFANASATDATNKLWFLGQGTFESATALTSVDLTQADTTSTNTIPAGDTGTGSTAVSGTGFFAVPSSLFASASALTTVKLPATVTTIYSDAFTGNTALSSVNFTDLTKLTSIQSTNFTGANALKTIDLSKTAMTASAFTVASIFTGLPTGATVNLPAAATSVAGTSFLIGDATSSSQTNWANFTYSSGLNLSLSSTNNVQVAGTATTVYYIGSGSSSTTTSPNPMLEYVSGDFDFTTTTWGSNSSISGAQLGRYYGWSFFGNTRLTSVTMGVSGLYLNGTAAAPTQATTLFMNRVVTNNQIVAGDYNKSRIPFGNNAALTDFTFTGFDVNASPTYPTTGANGATVSDNPLYKTTAKTWAQVATLINKFASNSVNAPTAWPTVAANTAGTNNINADSVVSGAQGTVTSGSGQNNTNYIVQITNTAAQNSAGNGANSTIETVSISVPNSLPAATTANPNQDYSASVFYHNGVKWTLTVYGANHKTNPGAITLVGENVNVYKATGDNGSNANMFCFNQGTTESSKITVTLNIVPTTKTAA